MVKGFLEVYNSFNLTQPVVGPTHEKGHTLDLGMPHDSNVCEKKICNTGTSDHFPVLFTVTLPGSQVKSGTFPAHIQPAEVCDILNSICMDTQLLNLVPDAANLHLSHG